MSRDRGVIASALDSDGRSSVGSTLPLVAAWGLVGGSKLATVTAEDYEAGRAALAALQEWWAKEGAQNRNEATTRLHLIDVILTDVLRWPKNHITAEHSHGGTYADYVIGRPATRLVVEAKREGIYFDLPVGVGPGVVPLSILMESADVEAAIRQVLAYCHERGVPLAAVSNGHQLIAFLANRVDGVPPLSGRALVFDSLNAIQQDFRLLWDNLSRDGVEALTIQATLGDVQTATPPAKLSSRIPGYPGFWSRNKIQTGLKILGDLVLQDILTAPDLEDEFLRRCYSSTNTLSEYAMVSREILQARYAALASSDTDVSLAPARSDDDLAPDLTKDVLAAALGRRPLILLGDVGVGKSIFIRHFMKIDAPDVMRQSIVLSIDFGSEPALADDLQNYVAERFVEQLRANEIDVDADKFVRSVYKAELRSFERSVYGPLQKTNPGEYELRELAMLEKKLSDRNRHLEASLRYASRALKRQVIIFLDNIDQRNLDFQERVFLIGQSLAQHWPATVFLTLRPETFYRSRTSGSLTAYQPRVFTVSPPELREVISKRLAYCLELVADQSHRDRLLPAALDEQAAILATYVKILSYSLARKNDLVEFVENLSGGNVREALGFLNTFVGSGHVNTQKILDIQEKEGSYLIALHEFVRAIIFGDHQYYDPAASPIANVFEISTDDGREHFLLPLILSHVERVGEVGRRDGFVQSDEIVAFGQTIGFLPAQVEFAIRHGADKRLLQMAPPDPEADRRRYRITTVGAYTYKRLMRRFVYIDAVVVDTPIVDDKAAERIAHCRELEDRITRAEEFVSYLDQQWEPLGEKDVPFTWPRVSLRLRNDFRRVSSSARRWSSVRGDSGNTGDTAGDRV